MRNYEHRLVRIALLACAVLLASCDTGTAATPDAIHGKWVATDAFVDGEHHEFASAVAGARLRLRIEFSADGLYSGSAPCNRIMGTYTFDGRTLETDNNAISAVLCSDAVMELEDLALAPLRAAPIQVTFADREGQATMEWQAGSTRMTLVRP